MEKEVVQFVAKIDRAIYNSENFDVYSTSVDYNEFPNIQKNDYGNTSICGNLGSLPLNMEYKITAILKNSKNGASYEVRNLERLNPLTQEEVFNFLSEILTENQATTLYENYPNIVDLIKENKDDCIDFSKLKGIGEITYKKIRKKIESNFCLAELVSYFNGYITLPTIKKIYTSFSTIQAFLKDFNKQPYTTLCSIGGVGFKSADAILLTLFEEDKDKFNFGVKDLKSSELRCVGAIIYLLQENEKNGNTVMNLIELRNQCKKLVPSCFQHFTSSIKDKTFKYDKENLVIGLSSTVEAEIYVAEKFKKALENKFFIKWDFIDIQKYKTVDNFELSKEQLSILEGICNNPIAILNGFAGAGKTFSTKAVINMLEDNGKSYMLLSPTGKASKVLSENTERRATTIHRGLGLNSPFPVSEITVDVVLIDEFSMCDLYLFVQVLKRIDFMNTRLVLVGDNAQLPSVGCGNLLHDFITSNVIPKYTLTKIFRYGEGGLMTIATDVRNQKPYLSAKNKNKLMPFGNNKDYCFIDTTNVINGTLAIYKKLLTIYKTSDLQVLTCMNKGEYGTIELNNKLQKIANPNTDKINHIKKTTYTFYENDLVMQVVNNYDAIMCDENGNFEEKVECFVANGESGVIKKIITKYDKKKKKELKFAIINFDGVNVLYDEEMLNTLALGYAITFHKSQGSGIKIPILCTPSSHVYMLDSNLLYVGLTRCKEKCYHVGNYSTVNSAVKKKSNTSRNTYMPYLLSEFPVFFVHI